MLTGVNEPEQTFQVSETWKVSSRRTVFHKARPYSTILLLTILLLGTTSLAYTQNQTTTIGQSSTVDFGVAFMSSAEDPAGEQQYLNALSTGATWNRWPFYWPTIEQSPATFDWSAQDATVSADLAHGLQINAILLGTPSFYLSEPVTADAPVDRPAGRITLSPTETATPIGLYDPIFTDGTDIPGAGKQINENNVWARFVYEAVERYRPGGLLARTENWPAGTGITHWEMWNEPDLPIFWDGTLPDYARLLKVGYLSAKQADPASVILFGGLANNIELWGYYNDVLNLYASDPLANDYAYFHDIFATHSYFYAWQSWFHVWRAGETMSNHGLDKPIWLNESGVPAWNDYPGPVWDSVSGYRATTTEQADFVIQSALYATYAGADMIFHFQLYDGCGNQPRGTDFPPHNGELCDASGFLIDNPGIPCAGDANGLFTNPTTSACFTQHPQPESPRPHYEAFRVLTTYFRDVEPLWRLRPGSEDPYNGPQEWLAFYRPGTTERIVGLWARFGEDEIASLPATSDSALLITPDGQTQTIAPTNGFYTLTLPAATNQNAPWDPDLYAIGGHPYLLIETDTIAPNVTLDAPAWAWQTAVISWAGDDNLGSGMQDYDVSVSVDGGAFVAWMTDTTATSGVYSIEVGRVYEFRVSGRDRANNTSPFATTTVTGLQATDVDSLPIIYR